MAKILVVEDKPANMKLVVLLLQNVGHTVLCAADAESSPDQKMPWTTTIASRSR